MRDVASMFGDVTVELFDAEGNLKAKCVTHNLITSVGDAVYVGRGSGASGAAAAPTGMKLGSGSTAVAKSGAGAALATYLSGSAFAFDSTFPSVTNNVVTYKRTYAAGQATTASPITEAVIVNDTIADATSSAANTVSRVLLTGIGSKGSSDTLTISWNHTITGS